MDSSENPEIHPPEGASSRTMINQPAAVSESDCEIIEQFSESFRTVYLNDGQKSANADGPTIDELVNYFHLLFEQAEITRRQLDDISRRLNSAAEAVLPKKPR